VKTQIETNEIEFSKLKKQFLAPGVARVHISQRVNALIMENSSTRQGGRLLC